MQKFLFVSLHDEKFALFASLSNEIEKNAPHTIQVTGVSQCFSLLSAHHLGEMRFRCLIYWFGFIFSSFSLSHIWKLDMDIDTDRDRAVRL